MSSCLESFEVGFDVVVVVRDAEGAGDALVEGSAVALEGIPTTEPDCPVCSRRCYPEPDCWRWRPCGMTWSRCSPRPSGLEAVTDRLAGCDGWVHLAFAVQRPALATCVGSSPRRGVSAHRR